MHIIMHRQRCLCPALSEAFRHANALANCAPDAQRIAVALAHLVDDAHGEELREVFIKKLGLPILLRALTPVSQVAQARGLSNRLDAVVAQTLREACFALHVLLQKVSRKLPAEKAPLPPTPEACLEEHFNNPELSDISFVVQGEDFYAHKIALARCPAEFHEDVAARKTSKPGDRDVVDFSHLSSDVFRALMLFMYEGKIDAERPAIALELLRAAVMYDMHELKRRCELAICEDVKTKGETLDAKEVAERFNLAESLDATSVSKTCALHALEHHASMMTQLGTAEFSQLTWKMVTRIDEHARALFHRLPVNLEAHARLTPN
jgi:hypothetical protein